MAVERVVAVLSPGEMGSQVGRVLRESGARVVTCLEGRGPESAERARAAGFEVLDRLEDVVRAARLVVAVVPPAAAEPLARRVAEAMRVSGATPLYVDANSIGPATATAIASRIQEAGGRFVDGCIIGGADELQGRSRFYLSGADAAEAVALLHPLQCSVLGEQVGQASGFKVLYAGLTKGMTALGVELLAGADALDLREPLMEKYHAEHPSVARFWERVLPGLAPRAERRAQEMEELTETLEGASLTAYMARGAQQALEAVAARHRDSVKVEASTA